MSDIKSRKQDHIDLAGKSVVSAQTKLTSLTYEPLFGTHNELALPETSFLGKTLKAPLWISSMTGGSTEAGAINKRLAKIAGEFGIGMGLGSCRAFLEDPSTFEDFNLRPLLGNDVPFFTNIGIAQLETLLANNEEDKLAAMVDKLCADGLIIHVNPLQEWVQPEGDRFKRPVIETLQEYFEKITLKTIVKEVGQGMGPRSLKALMDMPVDCIEFASLGGTNFSMLEIQRSNDDFWAPLAHIGHTAEEMVEFINEIKPDSEKEFIISGGVRDFIHAYELMSSLKAKSIVGMAGAFLKPARESEEQLRIFTKKFISGIGMASQWFAHQDTQEAKRD
ncbi:MAG: type 2 isopentenyl-diphosphate Delta-isomerase [Deltaproteobacteria bacterium]|nr:MAG: type 2 isopentenyl-diphosphate Delta-isomerase [Deltaproteobacteria bacterium]